MDSKHPLLSCTLCRFGRDEPSYDTYLIVKSSWTVSHQLENSLKQWVDIRRFPSCISLQVSKRHAIFFDNCARVSVAESAHARSQS